MQCRECGADLPAEARFCFSCGARLERAAPAATVDLLRESLAKAIGFQYRIERLLGRGGMGAVYLAHELALDRDVAIKVLPPDQAGTPDMRERFRREARTAARLSHPHIVPLYTFGEVAGLVYFVMGYVKGESLADRLQQHGPLESEQARTVIAGICDALAYAHKQGIVHRDIKPDNILIDIESAAPLLTDFGIAKATLTDAQLTTAQLTTAGQLIGTPHYMSPEQAMGQTDVGPASDVYSLGVVAYELISGVRPFEGDNPMDVLTQRLTREPKALGSIAPHVTPDLAQAIMRCLERDPANRWPDAKALREALVPSDEEPEESFPARTLRVAITVLPLALVGFGYVSLYTALNPEIPAARRLRAALIGALAPLVVMTLASTIRLRAAGFDLRSIIRNALLQPRWWRSWYPASLRRRGDVWSRLPPEIRRFRMVRGVGKMAVFGVVLPMFVIMATGRQPPGMQWAIWLLWVAAVIPIWTTRHAATRMIRAKTGVTATEASGILNTPTWRTAAWRRPPTASILK